MPDVYGVTAADIAAELPGLFPVGYDEDSRPTDVQVAGFITTADTIVTLRVTADVGQNPDANDKAAVMAKRYIIDWVKAMVVRVVYGGNDPVQVNAAAGPYEATAAAMLAAIDALGAQAIGLGEYSPGILTSAPPWRCLVIDDCDLDACSDSPGRF